MFQLVRLKTDMKSAKLFRYEAGSLLFAVRTCVGMEARLDNDRMPLHPTTFETVFSSAELLRIMREEVAP